MDGSKMVEEGVGDAVGVGESWGIGFGWFAMFKPTTMPIINIKTMIIAAMYVFLFTAFPFSS